MAPTWTGVGRTGIFADMTLATTPSSDSGEPAATSQPRTPLYDRHVAAGAKFAPFGGWEMPIEYADGGVLAEHRAVREAVGIFDVSHLGKVEVRGAGAVDFLNACFTNDIDRVTDGQAQYTLCCADDGGVVDDLIIYRRSGAEVFCIPNAANTAEVVRRLAAAAPDGIEVHNRHHDYAVIAVQGPASTVVLAELGLPTDHQYMSFVDVTWQGVSLTVCRTGYTGEHGYEVVVDAADAVPVWDALVAAAQAHDGRRCGLGARDTLRTEMGYALHGHEITRDITPVQARLGWAVGWDKPTFWGRDALVAEKAAGPRRVACGLELLERGVPRADMSIVADGKAVGVTTSGTFSPSRKVGIALGLVAPECAEVGTEVAIEVRGRRLPARVVRPPFVKPAVR